MFISRTFLVVIALSLTAYNPATGQSCSNKDSGNCDFEPYNPLVCGPNKNCGYDSFCSAAENGWDPDADCCQAPQPSGCSREYNPQICGSKECPYSNMCVAQLAGYSANQCTSPPEPCPEATDSCSGAPANPLKCGIAKNCPYNNFCLANSAGFDTSWSGTDCCQDTRSNTACSANIAPVSCGPPQKQCPYDNQCLADAAGYNSKQCCKSVPDGISCTQVYAPVECGTIPCVYSNECLANAAGYKTSECCPQAQGACTADNNPVECGGRCMYSSQSCASAAGFQSYQCCAQPKELSACPRDYAPVACSSANCIYDNKCIAELAGFDYNSCVPVSPQVATTKASSSASTTTKNAAATGSLAALLALAAL